MDNRPIAFDDLLEQVRAGSQEAAWDLIAYYGPKLRRIVRRRLPDSLRSKFDSIDFVQQAWKSVFLGRAKLDKIESEEQFLAYLRGMLANKVNEEIRHRGTAKCNVHRERALDGNRPMSSEDPTPSQIATARETWFRLLDSEGETEQSIVQLRYEGHSQKEIAEKLGVHENTVQRKLKALFERSAKQN